MCYIIKQFDKHLYLILVKGKFYRNFGTKLFSAFKSLCPLHPCSLCSTEDRLGGGHQEH